MANTETQSDQSFLDASDEAMMEMAPPALEEEEIEEAPIEEDTGDDTTENNEHTEEPASDTEERHDTSDEVSAETDEEDSVLSQDDDTEIDEDKEVAQDTTFDNAETTDEETDAANDEADPVGKIDYKAEYDRIMAPFKANGKTMQLDKAEDVIQLMSMGANYNQKMRALKPNLKIMKMLDNNNLLDESKLNYLIDLDKKNPDAITKLLKDSGIDPLNVDVEEDSKYKTNNAYTVSDKDVELDTVLEEIQHSTSYQETIDVISNKWDEPSKRIILDDPNIIRDINAHIADGVYAEIMTVVDRERVLGKLNGVPDITAYNRVGEHMQANGMFKAQQTTPAATTNVKPVENSKKIDPKLNKRKLAAGGTKSAPSKKGRSDFDPLALSDEEFEKLSVNDFK